ncbi:MAG TPA: L,D-transpeptidase family protein [Phycisphaerae bacterium]|nr:L,D-transpeptidase family protein [Phycisphaerae bacterium]HOJ76305.1 L,D-transpeptidase family protein [Phycisphaerae bacterium]HOM53711.1 L,D-transpeptidase family protein [Phycisphaerae bacterium]HOQ87231.1 L,D-transpeptidase family protein [Phycisphaerae bacterium]HPP29083.1 L,D-transpeptidase family protein [Phycisphaerae bacterium]
MRNRLNSSRSCAVLALSALLFSVPASRGQDSETVLRRNVAWQIALDRVGFSPGLIDGRPGPKTEIATREFQRVRGLPVTGKLDAATAEKLGVAPDNAFGRYVVSQEDLAEIGPAPTSWIAKSKLDRLGHESLDDVLAEKFHCAKHLLNTLNPGVNINALRPGQKVIVPIIPEPADLPSVDRLEINLTEKIIRAIDSQDRLVALFHCSIAADKSKLPKGSARVEVIVRNPDYSFDPAKWPEVKEKITTKLRIPPGPRNPVGRCWIGLSLPGYGIHGTPNPELIGKTGSHGCFRLTNWDALRLGRIVRPGTPVRFTTGPSPHLANR